MYEAPDTPWPFDSFAKNAEIFIGEGVNVFFGHNFSLHLVTSPVLPGFTSAGAVCSWPPLCAEPTAENQIVREKNTTRPAVRATDWVLSATQESQPHSDVQVLLSLPGIGRIVTATLLAEASHLIAERDYHALRAHAGVAPVTRQSGKRTAVLMRYGCNIRLRNALYHWSRVSMQNDPRSREHYHRLRAKGHSHGRALRGLADRLLALLFAMLKTQTLFDPALRQAAISSANSA